MVQNQPPMWGWSRVSCYVEDSFEEEREMKLWGSRVGHRVKYGGAVQITG